MLHKVSIAGLTMDPASNTPIIILKSEEDEQAVPIWIGLLEATSIASALQNIKYERPMTHDLLKNFADALQISIVKVEVCDLKDNTFYARIYFVSKDKSFDIDARPSDAIALALRAKTQIFVTEEVMSQAQSFEIDKDIGDKEDWKEWLEKITPEDFSRYRS